MLDLFAKSMFVATRVAPLTGLAGSGDLRSPLSLKVDVTKKKSVSGNKAHRQRLSANADKRSRAGPAD
ncbi:MAG: hypothetical protein RIE06_13630 [Roseibium album]|uniref:hypothetical protein n=1 Tax=Roseibium album TaxID=311410 RepID=UPI00131F0AD7|nr:hypothetical protein [Labrenzia sp. EL_195]MBG6177424.1 hypothetical protein [Labrenzia sp. EL_132]MBG6204279.1 hypothetical protein [Labrenzia sp. EL_13]MBG6232045.1 hypothetical protein [Labrenzia sp. EL_208]